MLGDKSDLPNLSNGGPEYGPTTTAAALSFDKNAFCRHGNDTAEGTFVLEVHLLIRAAATL